MFSKKMKGAIMKQRKMHSLVLAIGMIATLLWCSTSYASIIWDYSPATTGGEVSADDWINNYNMQSFAEAVSFASDTTVGGIDIYSTSSYGYIGESVTVRLWSDSTGQPGTLLNTIVTTITAIDTDGAVGNNNRKHADITPLTLTAGTTYWIGMTGTGENHINQTGLFGVSGGDGKMAQFNGSDTFSYFTDVTGDMAFRLEDTTNAVPEPTTMLLLGFGLMGLAGVRRKLKK
jgi:hypothetical protein